MSVLLQLMGLSQNGNLCNYGCTIVSNWDTVTQRLHSHPEEALVHYNNANNNNNFPSSPLYIALRNELTPIPVTTLKILLLANPAALTYETLDMTFRNPSTSREVMDILLDAKPDYYTTTSSTYRTWHPPLHVAAKRGRSVQAIEALLDRNDVMVGTSGGYDSMLDMRDCCCRLALHEACTEGSPDVLRLLLVEGLRRCRSVGGGLFDKDFFGLTPLECAILRMKHLENCYVNGGDNDGEGGSAYYHGTDFSEKRRDSWKRLVLCIQTAAVVVTGKAVLGSDDLGRSMPSDIEKIFDIPFLHAAINLAACESVDLRFDELFHLLLNTGHCNKKAAASIATDSGLLPFHLAEERGLTFSNGLMQIFDAYPEAIFRKDVHFGIIPRMIETVGESFGLNMVYAMVSNTPSLFDHLRNRQSDMGTGDILMLSNQCDGVSCGYTADNGTFVEP